MYNLQLIVENDKSVRCLDKLIEITNKNVNIYLSIKFYMNGPGMIYSVTNNLYEYVKKLNLNNIIGIDISDQDLTGDICKFLNNFPNLKVCYLPFVYDFSNLEILEYFYNKCIVFDNFDITIYTLIEFYKKHQDDNFYKHDMIKSGIFDISPFDLENVKLFYSDILILLKTDVTNSIKIKNIKGEYFILRLQKIYSNNSYKI
jgi:hypothetical protein